MRSSTGRLHEIAVACGQNHSAASPPCTNRRISRRAGSWLVAKYTASARNARGSDACVALRPISRRCVAQRVIHCEGAARTSSGGSRRRRKK